MQTLEIYNSQGSTGLGSTSDLSWKSKTKFGQRTLRCRLLMKVVIVNLLFQTIHFVISNQAEKTYDLSIFYDVGVWT